MKFMTFVVVTLSVLASINAQDEFQKAVPLDLVFEDVVVEDVVIIPTPCAPTDEQLEECKKIGDFDYGECRCVQIICDPAYGCGNWIGYPTCKCTECIKETCNDGTARNLDNGCQCPECNPTAEKLEECAKIGQYDYDQCRCIEIVCDPGWPFPENKVWAGYPTCDFICDPALPECPRGEPRNENCECPRYVCDPIWPPPFPANQWLAYPDCKWTCVVEKCKAGQRWSKSQCKCVCNNVLSCSDRRFWDENECKCKCREPCQQCAEPQIWNEKYCSCGCSAKYAEAKKLCKGKLNYWDEQSCSCLCYSKPRECCENKIWSNETCDCKCEFQCKCAPGFVWDPYTCNCVCPKKLACKPINGVATYFDEGSCSCLCENAKYSRCAFGFDHSICSCRPAFCKQTVSCQKGEEWDKYQCRCVSPSWEAVCTKSV